MSMRKRRGLEGKEGSGKRYNKGPRERHVFKALIPDGLAAGLLGSRGAVKEEIQNETGARLVFSNRGDYFPNTQFRVLGLYASDSAFIMRALEWIMPKIIEYCEEDKNPDLLGKEFGEYAFRFVVTPRMCSHIIGSGGANVKQMRSDTGAKVFLENEAHLDHQMGRVIGQPGQILLCLDRINDCIQSECDIEEHFVDFANIINFSEIEANAWAMQADPPPPEPWSPPPRNAGGRWLPALQALPAGSTWDGEEGAEDGAPQPGQGVVVPPPKPVPSVKAVPKTPGRVDGGSFGGSEAEADEEQAAPVNVQEELEKLTETLSSFPEGTAQLQYSLSCGVPLEKVELLAGDFTRFVEEETSTSIEIEEPEEIAGLEDQRMVTVVGQLLQVYAAHALLLLRVRKAEDAEAKDREVMECNDPKVLKARIKELEAQLAKLRELPPS